MGDWPIVHAMDASSKLPACFAPTSAELPDPQIVRVDLEALIDEVEEAALTLRQIGFDLGPVTFRDASRTWPEQIVEGRSAAADPDSVGLRASGVFDGLNVEGDIVLYVKGWADVLAFGGLPATGYSGLGIFATTEEALSIVRDFVAGLTILATEGPG